MLQSTLHYSFKVLCEHYLINHHDSSGEDKHCWLSYLDHIWKDFFFFLLLFDYAMKSGEQLSYWLFGYNMICWCKNFSGLVRWFLFLLDVSPRLLSNSFRRVKQRITSKRLWNFCSRIEICWIAWGSFKPLIHDLEIKKWITAHM